VRTKWAKGEKREKGPTLAYLSRSACRRRTLTTSCREPQTAAGHLSGCKAAFDEKESTGFPQESNTNRQPQESSPAPRSTPAWPRPRGGFCKTTSRLRRQRCRARRTKKNHVVVAAGTALPREGLSPMLTHPAGWPRDSPTRKSPSARRSSPLSLCPLSSRPASLAAVCFFP
jgi:hypothetical protein